MTRFTQGFSMFLMIPLVDRIRQSGDRDELLANFQLSMTELGFKWSNMSIARNMAEAGYEVLVSNWPEAVRLKFHEKTRADAEFASQLPPAGMSFTWDDGTLANHSHDNFISVLQAHGIRTGAFASLTDFNGRPYKIVVGMESGRPLMEDLVAQIIILATVTLLRLDSLIQVEAAAEQGPAAATLNLTETQHEILKWAAAGKSNSDIAAIMELSTSAVSYHLARIYKILGVATKLQAVALLTNARAHG